MAFAESQARNKLYAVVPPVSLISAATTVQVKPVSLIVLELDVFSAAFAIPNSKLILLCSIKRWREANNRCNKILVFLK
jgi:hypothetical protein